ncbi:MAG: GNAT family N-acetyltransferase [Nannocystaceae bacterium]|nr:GNAT family N-acetyltransferase [Myxococcales bacterium]
MHSVRDAVPGDLEPLLRLWSRYLEEHYGLRGTMTAAALARDCFGDDPQFAMCVAEDAGQLIGAGAWRMTYDLHHFVRGVELADLYVAPERRGLGVAASLITHVAARGLTRGAEFMRGSGPVEPTPARHLYERVCVFFSGDTVNVSARAFRHLASLQGKSPREICRALPLPAWNYEA